MAQKKQRGTTMTEIDQEMARQILGVYTGKWNVEQREEAIVTLKDLKNHELKDVTPLMNALRYDLRLREVALEAVLSVLKTFKVGAEWDVEQVAWTMRDICNECYGDDKQKLIPVLVAIRDFATACGHPQIGYDALTEIAEEPRNGILRDEAYELINAAA